MKRSTFLFLFLSVIICNINAQYGDFTCHFGINFEISKNPNWGYGEPVVVEVEPYSPAEAAGLKAGDIIMEIDGNATYLRGYPLISSWIFNSIEDEVIFTIRNVNTYFKDYKLTRKCQPENASGEDELAESYSFYSFEDVSERSFTLPLAVTPKEGVDFSDYHTFKFMDAENAPEIDKTLNKEIEKNLIAIGLERGVIDPDIFIQTYYSYRPNPNYKPSGNRQEAKRFWRYSPNQQDMVLFPLLPTDYKDTDKDGRFVLEIGMRFFEKKYIDSLNYTLIWECKVNEFATAPFTPVEYAKTHLPLIMMQYPYGMEKEQAEYVVKFKHYNYTGLYFDKRDMRTIRYVDRNSPAWTAGLRSGARIEKINNEAFGYNKEELLTGYKLFIDDTMPYRDVDNTYRGANSNEMYMLWDRAKYRDIEKAFGKEKYKTSFRYLFDFRSYIPSSKNYGEILFEAQYNRRVATYRVYPERRKSVTVRAL